MIRKLMLPVAVASLLSAGAAAAQAVSTGEKLDSTDARFIQDWVNKNHIDYVTTSPVATWQYIGATAGGVALRAVLDEKHGLGGTAKVGLRLEHFAPVTGVENMQTLSELASFDVDCSKNRIKHTSSTSYSLHSFDGERKTQTFKSADWTAASTMPLLDGAIKSACGKK